MKRRGQNQAREQPTKVLNIWRVRGGYAMTVGDSRRSARVGRTLADTFQTLGEVHRRFNLRGRVTYRLRWRVSEESWLRFLDEMLKKTTVAGEGT